MCQHTCSRRVFFSQRWRGGLDSNSKPHHSILALLQQRTSAARQPQLTEILEGRGILIIRPTPPFAVALSVPIRLAYSFLRGFSKSSMWTDLSGNPFANLFGLAPTCANIPNPRTPCRLGLGTRDLSPFPSASATGYIYTYGLMEPEEYAHQMHRR